MRVSVRCMRCMRCMRCIPSRASFHSLRIGIVNNGCVLQEGRGQLEGVQRGASSAVLPGAYRLPPLRAKCPSTAFLPACLDPRLPLSNARVERGVSSGAARRVAAEDHQPVDPPRRRYTHVLLYPPPLAHFSASGDPSELLALGWSCRIYWQFCSNS